MEFLNQCKKPLLLILDDLMIEAKSNFLNALAKRGSHHMYMSVIFVTQDGFAKELKTARNNADYIMLMRNPDSCGVVRKLDFVAIE
jgi:DNA replication protein DnaC